MADQLAAAEARAEAAELRARGLALSVAHVEHLVKSAVSVIAGWAKTADDRWDRLGDDARHEAVAVIRRQADQLVGQLDGLLAGARADATGRLDVKPTAVELSRLIRDLAFAADGMSDTHTVRFECDGDIVAWADPTAVGHIVAALVENALKYSPGGGEIVVSVRVADDRRAELAVRDHGVGLDSRGVDLFAPFQRGAHEGGAIAGAGLGLHLVKALVDQLGGSVTARANADGPGSTFTVALPLAVA